MFKQFLAGLMIFGTVLVADEIPDLTGYRKLLDSGNKLILVENFNKGIDDWEVTPSIRWDPKEGTTGTGALVATRDNPKEPVRARRKIHLKRNVTYRIRFDYRAEHTENPRVKVHEPYCVRFINSETKKVDRGAFHTWPDQGDIKEWRSMTDTFSLPNGYDEDAWLELIVRTARTGTVWYDNVTIEEALLNDCALFLLENSIMTYDAQKGVTFFVKAPTSIQEQDLAVLVETGNVRRLLPVVNGRARGKLGTLPNGRNMIKATLLDQKNKDILISNEEPLFVRTVPDIPGKIVMEPDGRMLRDGKPFLPVGVYLGFHEKNDTEQLKKIKEAGFNCIEGLFFNITALVPPQATEAERLKEACRELARHGLGVLVAIKYQVPKHPARREKLDNVTGLENVTRYVVDSMKMEPNVLGWYVSDENPLDEIPNICRLRETISEQDPWHPTMTLTDRPGNFLAFAKSGDYIMHDPYPVGLAPYMDGPVQTMMHMRRGVEEAKNVGTPFVLVPQIFPWGSSRKKLPNRYPTEVEMRSMALLGAIFDAKAYFFYSYHHCFYYSEKLTPGYAETHWNNVKNAVAVINELAPFFLSREEAPKTSVKQLNGPMVLARAFVSEGKTAVVITADGPGEATAEITVTGKSDLKSRFGRTAEIAPGIYRFKGLHIDSDVLVE